MARNFTSNFEAACGDRQSRPYFVLQIDWYDGTETPDTVYYLDRPDDSFLASGTRVPTVEGRALVVDWGKLRLTLRDKDVGGVDELTLRIGDPEHVIWNKLTGRVQQRQVVTIWRMFDADGVVWPTDAAKMFVGTMKPFAWSEANGEVTIPLVDFSKRLLVQVECLARKAVFEDVPPECEDKNIPLVWGEARRVPAVLIAKPPETKTRTPIPNTAVPPFDIDVDDHPSEINLPTGVGSPLDMWLGSDLINGYFVESLTPDTTPSKFHVTSYDKTTKASASIVGVYGYGGGRFAVIAQSSVSPTSVRTTLDTFVPAGTNVEIKLSTGWASDTIATITPNDPFEGFYKITFTTHNADVQAGAAVKFTLGSGEQRTWPAGTALRPKEGDWIYAVNAAPSKGIVKVEGFGTLTDASGEGAEDFILISARPSDTVAGTVETPDDVVNPYVENLDNNTWDYTGTGNEGEPFDLGRHISTITFRSAPRDIDPTLKDNRLWVTLQGCVTNPGNLLITNPAAVLVDYLENPKLMNVDSAYIDTDSFDDAATTLVDRYVGFAQVEAVDGLDYLQDLALQCRSVLVFDQGQATLKVLSNTAASHVAHYTHNDIVEQTFKVSELSVDELLSRLYGSWRRSWDDKAPEISVLGIDGDVEADFGLVKGEKKIWIYSRRTYAETEIAFWLDRWSRLYRQLEFSLVPHVGLKLQPGDWIQVSYLLNPQTYKSDLTTPTNMTVSSASYAFTAADVGRKLHIYGGTGFTQAAYNIASVSAGVATLGSSPGPDGLSGGVFSVGDVSRYYKQSCEVLEVADVGPTGLVEVVCRTVQPYTA